MRHDARHGSGELESRRWQPQSRSAPCPLTARKSSEEARMSRHKQARNCTILPWLSARPTNQESRFIQVGDSLLFCPHFQALSAGAKHLYLCMALECGGKRDFTFPLSSAKRCGIPPASFRRRVEELIAAGFLERNSGANMRQPNNYRFSFGWKEAA